MFDFCVPPGARAAGRTNDKGLVTCDRQTKKDAFYFYQANWGEAGAVHHQPALHRTHECHDDVKIYSNAKRVLTRQLTIGRGRGRTRQPIVFLPGKKCSLGPGTNIIEAAAVSRGRQLHDECRLESGKAR